MAAPVAVLVPLVLSKVKLLYVIPPMFWPPVREVNSIVFPVLFTVVSPNETKLPDT